MRVKPLKNRRLRRDKTVLAAEALLMADPNSSLGRHSPNNRASQSSSESEV